MNAACGLKGMRGLMAPCRMAFSWPFLPGIPVRERRIVGGTTACPSRELEKTSVSQHDVPLRRLDILSHGRQIDASAIWRRGGKKSAIVWQ
jgi:hypothetical protein